jgi:hypothetical protein
MSDDKVVPLPGARKRRRNQRPAIKDEGNVTILPLVTSLDIPVERVLQGAADTGLTDALVIGWDLNGEFYFSGSMASGPEALWLLGLAEKRLLETND